MHFFLHLNYGTMLVFESWRSGRMKRHRNLLHTSPLACNHHLHIERKCPCHNYFRVRQSHSTDGGQPNLRRTASQKLEKIICIAFQLRMIRTSNLPFWLSHTVPSAASANKFNGATFFRARTVTGSLGEFPHARRATWGGLGIVSAHICA